MKFKAGDIVICVDAELQPFPVRIKNTYLYVVESTGLSIEYVYIKGQNYQLLVSRFELYPNPTPLERVIYGL